MHTCYSNEAFSTFCCTVFSANLPCHLSPAGDTCPVPCRSWCLAIHMSDKHLQQSVEAQLISFLAEISQNPAPTLDLSQLRAMALDVPEKPAPAEEHLSTNFSLRPKLTNKSTVLSQPVKVCSSGNRSSYLSCGKILYNLDRSDLTYPSLHPFSLNNRVFLLIKFMVAFMLS